ncbi:hypothetical protein T4D_2482 [Trichinella pseudospiralis]|uniref:Uncharacterized protein n=1 Tax=Trichinella pseudospiralis TaxID=6337 RepID=A0A0V1FHD1_TRIPS|nr:hypothetical protein T4D_2482 [Trichinella pseudospiralis]
MSFTANSTFNCYLFFVILNISISNQRIIPFPSFSLLRYFFPLPCNLKLNFHAQKQRVYKINTDIMILDPDETWCSLRSQDYICICSF